MLSTQGQAPAPQFTSSCRHQGQGRLWGSPRCLGSSLPHSSPRPAPSPPVQDQRASEGLRLPRSPPPRPPSWAGPHQLPEPGAVVLVVQAGQEDEGGGRALVLGRVSIT